jgi:hypothetical protein
VNGTGERASANSVRVCLVDSRRELGVAKAVLRDEGVEQGWEVGLGRVLAWVVVVVVVDGGRWVPRNWDATEFRGT